jgi:hypothetical protein
MNLIIALFSLSGRDLLSPESYANLVLGFDVNRLDWGRAVLIVRTLALFGH